MLNSHDQLLSNKFFQRATRGIITIYLHLTDSPEDIDGLGHLPTAERKKERMKLKKLKEKEKKEKEAKEKIEKEEMRFDGKKNEGNKGNKVASVEDEDSTGKIYYFE